MRDAAVSLPREREGERDTDLLNNAMYLAFILHQLAQVPAIFKRRPPPRRDVDIRRPRPAESASFLFKSNAAISPPAYLGFSFNKEKRQGKLIAEG